MTTEQQIAYWQRKLQEAKERVAKATDDYTTALAFIEHLETVRDARQPAHAA